MRTGVKKPTRLSSPCSGGRSPCLDGPHPLRGSSGDPLCSLTSFLIDDDGVCVCGGGGVGGGMGGCADTRSCPRTTWAGRPTAPAWQGGSRAELATPLHSTECGWTCLTRRCSPWQTPCAAFRPCCCVVRKRAVGRPARSLPCRTSASGALSSCTSQGAGGTAHTPTPLTAMAWHYCWACRRTGSCPVRGARAGKWCATQQSVALTSTRSRTGTAPSPRLCR